MEEVAVSEDTGGTGEVIPEVSLNDGGGEPVVADVPSTESGSLLGSQPQEAPEAPAEQAPMEEPSIYGDAEIQWPENFSDEFKNETILKPYVNEGKFNVNGAIKSLIHAQKSLGQGRVRIPTEDSPQEDWQQFHQEVFGYNAKEEDYGVEFNKEESNFRDDFPEQFIKYAHENMYPPRLVEDVLGYMNALVGDSQSGGEEQYTEQVNKDIAELEGKWGAGFQRKIASANLVLERIGADTGFLDYMQDTNLKDDTKLAEFLAAVGEKLYGEDDFKDGRSVSGMAGRLTPEEAEIEINNVYSDATHPYHLKGHQNHQNAVEQMTKLFAMKRGEK